MSNEAAIPVMSTDDPTDTAASLDQPLPTSSPTKQKNSQRRRPNGASTAPAIDLGPIPKKERKRPADQGRKPNDGTLSRNQQRNQESLNFIPRVSHPADMVEITLKSEYALRLFAQHYGRAQVSLYNVTSVLPVLMRQNGYSADSVLDVMEQLETLLNSRIDELRDKIDVELRRLKKLSDSNAAPPTETYSRPPQTIAVAGLSPQILEMLNVLQQFDLMVSYVHGLWVGRAFTIRQRETSINGFRNEIAVLIRSFMRIYQSARQILDQKGDIASVSNILSNHDSSDQSQLSEEDEHTARELVAPVAAGLGADGFHDED